MKVISFGETLNITDVKRGGGYYDNSGIFTNAKYYCEVVGVVPNTDPPIIVRAKSYKTTYFYRKYLHSPNSPSTNEILNYGYAYIHEHIIYVQMYGSIYIDIYVYIYI